MNKKLLITIIGGALCSSSFATTPKDINKVYKINKHYITNNILLENSSYVKPNTTKSNSNSFSSKVTGKLKFIEVGSSPNLYTALVSESNCLTANQDLNTVMFTKRINSTQVDINAAGSTGIIQTSYSTDGGLSFDTTLTIVEDPTNKFLCRYPSGSLINPKGNKNPAKAFAVVSGPWHPGKNWSGNYFGSSNLDGKNIKNIYIDNSKLGNNQKSDFARLSAQSTDNGKCYVMGNLFKNVNGKTGKEVGYTCGVMHTGTLNDKTNSIDWSTKTFPHSFVYDTDSGTYNVFSSVQCAWSQDGLVGYVVYIGQDSATANTLKTWQPIVYKTIDEGKTWNFMPMYDFGKLKNLTNYVRKPHSGNKRPMFTIGEGMDLTVDANYNLHIVSAINSASSSHKDSLDYVWAFPKLITDVHTTSNGWDALVLDTLMTSAVKSADSPWVGSDGTAGNGWDARIQISRTQDGKRIFYGWMDTDSTWGESVITNLFPDIFAKGYNVETGLLTPTYNFTNGSEATHGLMEWMYFQNITLKHSNSYDLGFTTTVPYSGQKDAISPVKHYYISGISFEDADFTLEVKSPCLAYTPALTILNPDTCGNKSGLGKGSIIAKLSGTSNGTHLYSVQGNTQVSNDTLYNIKAGTNILSAIDTNNCEASLVFNMPEFGSASSATFVTKATSGCKKSDGMAIITALPVDTGYKYNWNSSPIQNNDTAIGLEAINYTVTVTSSIGCTSTFKVSVPSETLPVLSVIPTNAKCFRSKDGSASVSAIQGTAPYSYTWDNGKTGSTITNLSAGTYSVSVKDGSGCTSSIIYNIDQPEEIKFTTTFSWSNAGNNTSSSEVSNLSGGVAPYSFSWSTDPSQTTQIATNINNDEYTVTVTDANGCSVTRAVNTVGLYEVSNNDFVSLYPNPTSGLLNMKISNEFGKSANISIVNVTGEVVANYTFNTNSINSIDITSLSSGLYFVRFTSGDKTGAIKIKKD